MFYIINILPVIILSAHRTGSSVLSQNITNQLNEAGRTVTYFSEPLTSYNRDEFLQAIGNKAYSDYVLKLHAVDLPLYPNKVKNIIKAHKCTLVRIRRKNIVDQITSLYISNYYKRWHYDSTNNPSRDAIPINEEILLTAINWIRRDNPSVNEFDAFFDLDLWYEDLDFDNVYLDLTHQVTMVKAPRPSNYIDIQDAVKTRLFILEGSI